MEQFMAQFPSPPDEIKAHAFIQETAVQVALTATRDARLSGGQPDLWHDASHLSTTPVIDLAALQQHNDSRLWMQVLAELKPRAHGLLSSSGVSDTDAEDLFAESVEGIVRPRKDGTAILHDLLVYEQLPPLFIKIVQRRLANHIRHRHADKRDIENTVSLENDDLENLTLQTVSSWAADAADPLSGLTLTRLAEECAHHLSPLHQRILSVLYLEESALYMEVASSRWFMEAVGLKATASEATRRRALDREVHQALDLLATCLGITRKKS